MSLVAVALVGSACGSPTITTISQMPESTAVVATDDGSDMGVPDSPASTNEVVGSTIAPLGHEGAFNADDGRPVRVLVRPEGVEAWHWVDAQTGEYIALGEAPVEIEFDRDNVVSARADVAPNCEDEGSGLHITVGHATVQKSGRYIASEAVFQNNDCSGEPFAWRAVAIDRDTGVPVVRFRLGDGSTAVTELQYDPTGTWLLISLADGSIEWQGGSGRVELEAEDASGAIVQVAEASWGTRPPVGDIPGRVFVPNASGDGSSIGDLVFPPQRAKLEHGGEAWAVVLAAAVDENFRFGPALQAAEAAGYTTGVGACDQGDDEAFGWTGGDGSTVVIFLESESDAVLAARLFERAGVPAAPALVTTFCLD